MDGDCESIKDRPATLADVFEPWEAAGESRRDCQPHRAEALQTLARLGMLAGGLSFPFFFPCVPGLTLGALTRLLARRDLDLICRGHMDHRGYHTTLRALSEARAALVLSLLGLLLWIFVCGFVVLLILIARN
jgi:hypothetical protein